MSPDRSHCEGCFRTLDDIRAWSQAGNSERRRIWTEALCRAGIDLRPHFVDNILRNQLAIQNPDSCQPEQHITAFPAIRDYAELLPLTI